MKTNEQVSYDNKNDKIIVKSTHENQIYLDRVQDIRKTGRGVTGENRFVGSIPMHVMQEWCKEAGIKWDDVNARKEIVRKKLLSGDFDKLRVWKGTF